MGEKENKTLRRQASSSNWSWWPKLVISVLKRQRQEVRHEFELDDEILYQIKKMKTTGWAGL